MAATPIEDALELLTKENERYRLSQIGFFRDVSREAELLVSNFPPEEGESFQAWKRRSLREYYRLRGFSAFCRRSIDRQAFESIVMRLTDNHLRHIFRSSPRTETDKYLAPDSDTVSYAMTQT
ncbi:MAG TPA: hypothetical protein IAC04_06255, partial [Candidatus Coprenecus stercoravium]|nr:hypothetical protein [Candidatus Coprenecus stercoravium]